MEHETIKFSKYSYTILSVPPANHAAYIPMLCSMQCSSDVSLVTDTGQSNAVSFFVSSSTKMHFESNCTITIIQHKEDNILSKSFTEGVLYLENFFTRHDVIFTPWPPYWNVLSRDFQNLSSVVSAKIRSSVTSLDRTRKCFDLKFSLIMCSFLFCFYFIRKLCSYVGWPFTIE